MRSLARAVHETRVWAVASIRCRRCARS